MSRTASPLRDPELVEMLGREPELLAIADAVAETADTRAFIGRGRSVALVGVPAFALAAALAVAVLLWPFKSSPSVLQNALAAIGSGSVTHVVVQNDVGATMLDLKTGRTTPVSGRISVWYAQKHGILYEPSFRGVGEGTLFFPTPKNFRPARPDIITEFVTDYRAALRAHQARLVGSGTYRGMPVYWIDGQPRYEGRAPTLAIVAQVAVSKATFKPVFVRRLINGKPVVGSGERVFSITTSNSGPPQLYKGTLVPIVGWFGGYPEISRARAKAMRPTPVVPDRIGALKLSWVGSSGFYSDPNGAHELPGVWLYYGPIDVTGIPNGSEPGYTGRWVQIIEFTTRDALVRQYRGHFPSGGQAVIDGFGGLLGNPVPGSLNHPTLGHTATLEAHGRYYIIMATTTTDAIAAARIVAR